jgi:PAS domain S-box-containing protein
MDSSDPISSETLYRTLTNALSDIVVIVFDESLRCRLVSGDAEHVLNMSARLINGQTMVELFSEIAPQSITHGQAALKGVGHKFGLNFQNRVLQVQVLPVFDKEQRVTAGMLIFEEQHRQLRDEEMLRVLVETTPDAMIILDSRGKIILVNGETERLFDYTQDELLGQPVDILLPFSFRKSHQRSVQNFLANPLLRKLDSGLNLVALRRDGTEFPVDISLRPIQTPQGMVVASAIRDISARKQLEESLRQVTEDLEARVIARTAELEARNEELDAFAQTVAHDLKNPLSLVTGMAEMLLQLHESLSSDELERYLSSIARDAHKMDNIIDDLMVLSTVGYTQPHLEAIDVRDLAVSATKQLDPMVRQFEAEISIARDWPTAVGYAPWIEIVWANYISNAIKYGGTPPVIRLDATSQSDGSIKFWIEDNGDGLTSDEQEKLFLEFTRLSVRRVEGHGLGLSIVRRVVERLGGQVGVESSPGQGSRFYFLLPAARPA